MTVTCEEFWKLLGQSDVMSRERSQQVQTAWKQSQGDAQEVTAKALGDWLIRKRVLTRYQASVLLRGQAGPFRYGDYRILDRVRGGRLGGMFRAVHVGSKHPVLLRFLTGPEAQDPRIWAEARRHIQQAGKLAHPQLQRVFALLDLSPYRFLVLESLSGKTLGKLLRDQGRLPYMEVSRLVRLFAMGLHALHQQNQVHGDIRPDNIWLEVNENSKLVRDAIQPPSVPGLPGRDWTGPLLERANYMAPELGQPGPAQSPLTDIYALGCVAYQMLTGTPPFAGGDAVSKMHRHATQPIQPLEPLGVPPAMIEAITYMMAKNPKIRTSDAATVANQLKPFVAPDRQDDPESPVPPTLVSYEAMLNTAAVESSDAPPVVEGTWAPPPQPPTTDSETVVPSTAAGLPPGPPVSGAAIQLEGTESHFRPTQRLHRARQSRRKNAVRITIAVSALLAIGAIYVAFSPAARRVLSGARTGPAAGQSAAVEQLEPTGDAEGVAAQAEPISTSGAYEIWPDDGKMLWMTPTDGAPIQLSYVPPGAQMVLVTAWQQLVNSPEGQRVLRAMGPQLETWRKHWEAVAGINLDDVQQLVITWHDAGAQPPPVAVVVHLRQPREAGQLVAAWGDPPPVAYKEQEFYQSRSWSFFIPPDAEQRVFVMGNEQQIKEVIEQGNAPALMLRELTRLFPMSDRDRHITLLFAPRFFSACLFRDGRRFFFGDARRARVPLEWLFGESVKAGMVSLHFQDRFYFELRAYGEAGRDSLALADSLRDRMREVPDRIETYFQKVYPSPYWRRVALRFPEMVRFASEYTRVGVEDEQAVVNGVLPGSAVHNLVFAGSMLLVESDSTTAPVAKPAPPQGPRTIDELLAGKMNLSFDQKSLEFAMRDLATEIREAHPNLPFPFDIKILGTDLQLNGITRNQQISSFSAEQETVAQILTDLVRRANPVTTVQDPSELDQKLIWVVGPDPAAPKNQILLITTRDAAKREGYTLPAPFQPK